MQSETRPFGEEDLPSKSYDPATILKIHEYLRQLSPIQLKAYRIAKRHLGSSFNLIKSNGYTEWLEENK